MKTKVCMAEPAHEVLYQDLCALVSKHAAGVSSMEMLAIASNMVGKLVAMQDQRIMTAAMAMEVVATNLKEGNRQVLARLSRTESSA